MDLVDLDDDVEAGEAREVRPLAGTEKLDSEEVEDNDVLDGVVLALRLSCSTKAKWSCGVESSMEWDGGNFDSGTL